MIYGRIIRDETGDDGKSKAPIKKYPVDDKARVNKMETQSKEGMA
jgi:hypothetical protein